MDINKKLHTTRVIEFRKKSVPNLPGLTDYISEVSASFCPYIGPSTERDDMSYSIVESDTDSAREAQSIIFACGYILSEILRKQRFTKNVKRPPTLCENVIFVFPRIQTEEESTLLSWPHWILKTRYTELGILFGKFSKGIHEESKDGRYLPIPPYHMLSIRESVRKKDPKFFERAEWLRPSLESADDLGQDVFEDLDMDYSGLDRLLDSSVSEESSEKFVHAVTEIAMSGVYEEVKKIADCLLKKKNNKRKL